MVYWTVCYPDAYVIPTLGLQDPLFTGLRHTHTVDAPTVGVSSGRRGQFLYVDATAIPTRYTLPTAPPRTTGRSARALVPGATLPH